MDYNALETEIVGALNAYFTANSIYENFQARPLPENQSELLETYEKSLVNVHYSDSSYTDPRSTDQIVQDETVRVVCYLQCDTMKDATKGGYLLLKHIKAALLGYKPENARTRMWISSYGDWTVAEAGQVNPYIEFAFGAVNTQEIEENEALPDGLNESTSLNSVYLDNDLIAEQTN